MGHQCSAGLKRWATVGDGPDIGDMSRYEIIKGDIRKKNSIMENIKFCA